MNVAQFQQWLNDRGASLAIDGVAGPATRAAILEVFKNCEAPAVTPEQIAQVATKIGVSSAQVRAVASVESSGGGYGNDCLIKILWERHYFWNRIRIAIPWISNPKGGDYTLDANRNNINDSWEKLCLAVARNPIAAFESASWGKFQIMGAHAKSLGYANALEFAYSLTKSEAAQYEALARFVMTNGLAPAMRKLSRNADDCKAFALGYNGKLGVRQGYHTKLAVALRA